MAGAAALASWLLAGRFVTVLEGWTKTDVSRALGDADLTWAEVDANGLQVSLTGAAPEESARFRALEVAGQIVGTSRIQDNITIAKKNEELVPEFQIEILRNGDDVSLIGLMPDRDDRVRVLRELAPLHEAGSFSDLMEALDYPAPEGWAEALNYALEVLPKLNRSTLIVTPGALRVQASLQDAGSLDDMRSDIQQGLPEGVTLELALSAPKELLSPFQFEASANAEGQIEITTCNLDSETSLQALLAQAQDGDKTTECALALGAPSAQWISAILASLEALRDMKGGSVKFSDADVAFTGSENLDPAQFASLADVLGKQLPPVFSLNATPADPPFAVNPTERPDAPRFRAAVDARDGLIVTGALRDGLTRDAVGNFARSLFGVNYVDADLAVDTELNYGWTGQVLAALEAASHLHEGVVEIEDGAVKVTGVTIQEAADTELRAALMQVFDVTSIAVEVTFDPARKAEDRPQADARICERKLATLMRDNTIIFTPNSADISNESELLLDRIAAIISSCENARFEIGGHTDSQGREGMNLGLSQSRADAVMDALLARDVLLEFMLAKGYGETQPIAENDTEEGRARNRRIAFRLIASEEDLEAAQKSDAPEGGAASNSSEDAAEEKSE